MAEREHAAERIAAGRGRMEPLTACLLIQRGLVDGVGGSGVLARRL